MVQATERGTRVPGLKVLEKLAPVLGFDLHAMVDLARQSRVATSARKHVTAPSDAPLHRSGTALPQRGRPPLSFLRLDNDQSALHLLSWAMRDLRTSDVETIQALAFPALDEYSKPRWRLHEQAQGLLIGFHLTLAAAVQELNAVPAMAAGLWHAAQAKDMAIAIGDSFRADLATWYEAVLRRKRAIVRGKRWADADLDNDLFSALRLEKTIVDSSLWPEIVVAASAEQMKLAIIANEATWFADALSTGEQQARTAIASRERWHTSDVWPAFFTEHMHTVLYDANVRGFESFGIDKRLPLDRAVIAATRFPQGLSVNIGQVTLELGKAAALLRLDSANAQREGLELIARVSRFARATGQEHQVKRVERMLRDRERSLPLQALLWCEYCEQMIRNADNH